MPHSPQFLASHLMINTFFTLLNIVLYLSTMLVHKPLFCSIICFPIYGSTFHSTPYALCSDKKKSKCLGNFSPFQPILLLLQID
jgi:hypothetical protein